MALDDERASDTFFDEVCLGLRLALQKVPWLESLRVQGSGLENQI